MSSNSASRSQRRKVCGEKRLSGVRHPGTVGHQWWEDGDVNRRLHSAQPAFWPGVEQDVGRGQVAGSHTTVSEEMHQATPTSWTVVLHYGVRLLWFVRMLCPKVFFPLPKSFLRSMGEWAVEETGQKVKVVVADFTQDGVFGEIEHHLKDLEIGVLVNNVGILPSMFPAKFLETANSDQVFVERFSRSLQAEYRVKGIIIQTINPFGVSTSMTGFQKGNLITLLPEDFVRSSLQYLKAGDKINGSVVHTVMAWFLQTIPSRVLSSETLQQGFKDFLKSKVDIYKTS
ncbi:hypothetical protein CRUP_016586 [Coryphaenoides rupestris]|nr:hypothetical protein CRUP_016586 [Coryphaenoides rupestris]